MKLMKTWSLQTWLKRVAYDIWQSYNGGVKRNQQRFPKKPGRDRIHIVCQEEYRVGCGGWILQPRESKSWRRKSWRQYFWFIVFGTSYKIILAINHIQKGNCKYFNSYFIFFFLLLISYNILPSLFDAIMKEDKKIIWCMLMIPEYTLVQFIFLISVIFSLFFNISQERLFTFLLIELSSYHIKLITHYR